MPGVARLQFKRTLVFFNNYNRHSAKFNSVMVLRACCIPAAIVTQRYIAVIFTGIQLLVA
jgi:hypothetical protein